MYLRKTRKGNVMPRDTVVTLARAIRAVLVHGKTGQDVAYEIIPAGTTVTLLGQFPEAPDAPRFVMWGGYLYRLPRNVAL